MHVQPYLNYGGQCEEAMEFYRRALGAEVTFMMRFKDMPQPHPPGGITPGTENKVMHASMRIGDTEIFLSDGRCEGKTHFHGVSLSITVSTDAEAERLFAAVGEGGQVAMPLAKTFFSPRFGMVVDRFGLCWMIIVAQR